MNRIMEIPGFKGVIVEKMEQLEERVTLHVSMPKKEHTCPDCKKKTIRVHDYRIQKIFPHSHTYRRRLSIPQHLF